jgi:hypothetical protein
MSLSIGVVLGSTPYAMTQQHRSVGNHAYQFSRLLIGYNWHGADIAIAQDSGDRLRIVTEHAADWISAHDFADLHASPLQYAVHSFTFAA